MMSDELKTVKMINDKSEDMEFDREYEIRELSHIIPRTDCGMVKPDKKSNRITKEHMVFFKNRYEAEKFQDALEKGKTVYLGLKDVDRKKFVIESEIRTPNVEIKEASLSEQKEEQEAFGGY